MYKRFWKRLIDTVLSLIALVILSPLLLITALAVKISSPGPVLFKQQRLGLHGKVFTIYKFRSMTDGAEHTGSGVYSGKGDPRVTKVGKLIRATSIDELPQLINIIVGDMSIVGPRYYRLGAGTWPQGRGVARTHQDECLVHAARLTCAGYQDPFHDRVQGHAQRG